MRGWAGSLRIGLAPPGTIEKSTLNVSHPAFPDEKSGGDACRCASAPAVSAMPAQTPATSNFTVDASMDIVFLSCVLARFPDETASHPRVLCAAPLSRRQGWCERIFINFTAVRYIRHGGCAYSVQLLGGAGELRWRNQGPFSPHSESTAPKCGPLWVSSTIA